MRRSVSSQVARTYNNGNLTTERAMKKGFLVLVFLCSLSIFSSTSRAGITTKFFMGAPPVGTSGAQIVLGWDMEGNILCKCRDGKTSSG